MNLSTKKIKKILEKQGEIDEIKVIESSSNEKINELVNIYEKIKDFDGCVKNIKIFFCITIIFIAAGFFNSLFKTGNIYIQLLFFYSCFASFLSIFYYCYVKCKLSNLLKEYKKKVLTYGNDLEFFKKLSFKCKKLVALKNRFVDKLESSLDINDLNDVLNDQTLLSDAEFEHLEYLINKESLNDRTSKIYDLKVKISKSLVCEHLDIKIS